MREEIEEFELSAVTKNDPRIMISKTICHNQLTFGSFWKEINPQPKCKGIKFSRPKAVVLQKLGEINEGLEAPELELQSQIDNVEACELITKEVSISEKKLWQLLCHWMYFC